MGEVTVTGAQRDRSGRARHHVDLPRAPIVETGRDQFEATEEAEPHTGWRGRYRAARSLVLGPALSTHRLQHERLTKLKALPVFSSDAISSVAYATDEILLVLVLAGSSALKWSLPIAGAIVVLLAIVISSYRQTVRAYPNGGGSYIVAHSNLGVLPGLIAAASLLTDYVLTVSVSIASGVDALASLDAAVRPWAVPLSIVLVAAVALINLRGVRESGTVFAIPTYAFIALLGTAIGVALLKTMLHGHDILATGTSGPGLAPTEGLTIFLLLKAFASGCSAMTGVEAISNGVQAFKAPESHNARVTLTWMGIILGSLFIGSTVVARHYGFVPGQDNTILAQIGRAAFGAGSPLFALLNILTAAILVLAANTSFADFPRLAAILARDGYMPRAFHARGSRLVFSVGIIVLAVLSCALLVGFNATTTRLIPLYAVGVFTAFTLSQGGMVRHWLVSREPGWMRPALINGFGALATGIVLLVIIEAKFGEGAWAILVLVPLLIAMFAAIARFYASLQRRLALDGVAPLALAPGGPSRELIVVPAENLDRAALSALEAACAASARVVGVHVALEPGSGLAMAAFWKERLPGVPLIVIESPYRSLNEPIAAWLVDRVHEAPYRLTVMAPRIATRHWWERLLVNQSLGALRRLLAANPRVHVVDIPFAL